jgi:dienelactone hydrolase
MRLAGKAALLLIGIAAVALSAVAFHQGSVSSLSARKGRLQEAHDRPAGGDEVSTYSEVTLRRASGRPVETIVRAPRAGAAPRPAVVLVGGVKRGKKVALVPGLEAIARFAVIVSPDYPLNPHRRDWQGARAFGTAARLRSSAFDLIADIGLAVDYLRSRADVRADGIFLVGSSLGAPAVVIAGAVDSRPAAVIALYGGGDVGSLAAHTLALAGRDGFPAWQAAILGRALALFLTPLEPTRYAGRIAPRPFLMVNGDDDIMIPRANVSALFAAAREPKTMLWVAGTHVEPDEAELIRGVSGRIAEWLSAQGLLSSAWPLREETPRRLSAG